MTDIKTIKHLSKVVSVAKNTGIDALIVSYNMIVNTGKGEEKHERRHFTIYACLRLRQVGN